MKRNLSAAAFALAGLSSAASAQSVLERVLSQIDNTASLVPVTGTFANIAENIGTVGTQTFYVDAQGNTISQQSYVAAVADKANANLDNIFKLSWAYMYTDTTGNPHFYPDLA
ncbi:MAG: hypothetical protein GC146_05925, partial [Limimaricola sp.]|uniref:hypothetical protein n=1 Tax=Limimaricola sp. TaxID=2211665 RepID=UPI001D5A9483